MHLIIQPQNTVQTQIILNFWGPDIVFKHGLCSHSVRECQCYKHYLALTPPHLSKSRII